MITKPKRFGVGLMTIVYGLTMMVPLLAITLASSGTADAANSAQYVFYYDPSNVAAIKQALANNNGITSPILSNFLDTSVYGKGGVFGSTPVGFAFDQSQTAALPNSTNGVATPVYASNPLPNCTGTSSYFTAPTTFNLVLDVTLHLTPADIFAGSSTGPDIVSGTLSIDENLSQTGSGSGQSLSDMEQSFGSTDLAKFIPQSCAPPGFNLTNNSEGIRISNYQAMVPSAQKGWPGLQTSSALLAAAFGAANPPTSPGAASSNLSCTIKFGSPLTWVICPVVDALTGIVSGVDSLITQQMDINTGTFFCGSSTCGAYYSAWQSFRDIALGLLVVAGLVIVISEALGMEILDAYTIKKTLPRLLVAAIGITISWPLMNFAVTASDVLGIGVRHLIYYPFTQIHNAPDLTFGGNAANFFFGAGAVAGGTLAAIPVWIAFGGLGALLSLAATAALAVVVAIIVLTVRQIVIILLIRVSPIAIVAYILPRTQQIYKFWWSNFSRALLMFPMIAAMIATGRVFAAVSFSRPGVINQFIGFIAYFAPYFMIPMTFKLSGALMGTIGNAINSRAQPARGMLSKYRANQTSKRTQAGVQKFRTGEFGTVVPGRFKRLNRLNRAAVGAVNEVGKRSTSGIRGGFGFGKRGETASEGTLAEAGELASKEKGMKEKDRKSTRLN